MCYVQDAREKKLEGVCGKMLNVGDIVVKIVGRESGRYCVIVEKVNDSFVVIDGDVKKRKCNVKHLEPTGKSIKVDKNIKKEDIIKELIANKFKIKEKKEVKRSVKEKKEDKVEKKTGAKKKEVGKNKQRNRKPA